MIKWRTGCYQISNMLGITNSPQHGLLLSTPDGVSLCFPTQCTCAVASCNWRADASNFSLFHFYLCAAIQSLLVYWLQACVFYFCFVQLQFVVLAVWLVMAILLCLCRAAFGSILSSLVLVLLEEDCESDNIGSTADIATSRSIWLKGASGLEFCSEVPPAKF